MVAVLANSLDTFSSMQNLATEIITAVTYNDELSEYTISHDLSQARYSEVATVDRPVVITAKNTVVVLTALWLFLPVRGFHEGTSGNQLI